MQICWGWKITMGEKIYYFYVFYALTCILDFFHTFTLQEEEEDKWSLFS